VTPSRVVIADAGPLIALARLDLLSLLEALFDEVALVDAVAREVFDGGAFDDAARIRSALKEGWLRVQAFDEDPAAAIVTGLAGLGAGESQSILWALQLRAANLDTLLLMDDAKGRVSARRVGLDVIGAAGVLALARRAGLVPALRPLLDALRADGYFLSTAVVEASLRLAGEA
jgi:predicted nucleic acid-binding protein